VSKGHKLRRSFFSESAEPNDAGFGVAEDAADGGFRDESWEPISVLQTPLLLHSRIMAGFQNE
jgi:hypothetical protein